MSCSRIHIYSWILCLIAVFSVSVAYGVTIDTVRVGDPGNQADMRYETHVGYGSVGYVYNIGKYEVTAGQYCNFLNAVGATDTYGLYHPDMSDPIGWQGCNIQRSGLPGSYSYSVAADWANRPVNEVSFWDACRFANWLHNRQPTGPQNASTTEDGAYLISGYSGADGRTIQRKPGARWFIPSENEWYKAAFYKGGGTTAGYWNYPTRSDTVPGRDLADVSGNNANYAGSGPIDNGKYTTLAGEFQNSASPYGTFDQGGNVWEWNETVFCPDESDAYRGIRGGSFGNDSSYLRAYDRHTRGPSWEGSYYGFRVAEAVPEPSSMLILATGVLGLAGMIRRKK